MRPQPRLSKSRYIVGLQCARRLWLGWHDPEPREEPEPGSILAVGIDVGVAARLIIPGGILVKEGPQDHSQAAQHTKQLIADPVVPAIFEAAFAFDNVLIRVDILERLHSGEWRLARSNRARGGTRQARVAAAGGIEHVDCAQRSWEKSSAKVANTCRPDSCEFKHRPLA